MDEIRGLLVVDGQRFPGILMGHISEGPVFGEVVFNTCMTGYQEVLTDPSYAGQMINFTAAHIGNTGINPEDFESSKIYASAAILANVPKRPSNFRSTESLDDFLRKNKVVGLRSVDTRALTLFLRDRGVTPGFIIPETLASQIPLFQNEQSQHRYDQIDWISKVTTREPYEFKNSDPSIQPPKKKYRVVAYDFGIKRQLLRELTNRGCEVEVVPSDYPAEKILQKKIDGVFLSNGPGDPMLATGAVKNVKALLGKVPIFGVCMGHQVLALALGAKTYKLKFGHRGGNQPVQDSRTSLVEISSHNHGYAVDEKSLPATAKVTHLNLNDHCVEGMEVPSLRAFSVQYHPESSPGPHDSSYLFDDFLDLMNQSG